MYAWRSGTLKDLPTQPTTANRAARFANWRGQLKIVHAAAERRPGNDRLLLGYRLPRPGRRTDALPPAPGAIPDLGFKAANRPVNMENRRRVEDHALNPRDFRSASTRHPVVVASGGAAHAPELAP